MYIIRLTELDSAMQSSMAQ